MYRQRQSLVAAWMIICQVYFSTPWRFFYWRRRLQCYSNALEGKQTYMKQTLLIVRHGQTTWNVEHRLPGQLPGVALNNTGCEQAALLGEALRVLPISAIISSPLERAYHTAEYLIQGRSLEIRTDPDLMDTNVGAWAGQRIEDVSKNDPAWKEYVKNPTVAPEGVETFPQVQQRVVAAVERWRTQDNIGAYPVFVAHADVVKLLLAHYMGLDVAHAGTLHIDNASVSLVEIESDPDKGRTAHIVALGWTPRPGWLKVPSAEKQETPAANEPQGVGNESQEVGEQKL
jgi:probable phosphoglycerate mutase